MKTNISEILDRDPSWFKRVIKEAIYIRAHRPTSNKDGSRYNLSHLGPIVNIAHVLAHLQCGQLEDQPADSP